MQCILAKFSKQAQLLGKEQFNKKFSLVSFLTKSFVFLWFLLAGRENVLSIFYQSSICIWVYFMVINNVLQQMEKVS